MKLMLIVVLYGICFLMIRGVLLKVFGGRRPSGKVIGLITLLAFFWPIWPEIAALAFFGFVIKKFIDFCNANQEQPGH